MPSLTFATCLPYLLGLGLRFKEIGRSELTLNGEASENASYPLLLVEGDPQGSELMSATGVPSGQDTFTIALQVLTQRARPNAADLQAMLQQTNQWADQLCEQLRFERPQQLAGVSKLSLPGQAGTDLACGWRVELSLKLAKDIDRNANKALFTPEA